MVDFIRKVNSEAVSEERLACEKARIYTPDGTDSAWYYSHHTYLTKFKGKFYAVYSSGRRNEDDCRQRIMMATSENFKDWEVKVFQDSRYGKQSDIILYCMGIYTDGETLSVLFNSWEFRFAEIGRNPDGSYRRPDLPKYPIGERHGPFVSQSTDGVTWSEPEVMEGEIFAKHLAGNHSPFRLSSGRIVWPGFASTAYTDDPTLKSGWRAISVPIADEEEKAPITESTVLEYDDGKLLCFNRMGRISKTISAAVSVDNGTTWTSSYRTDFLNSESKFQFGRLPDGRYYYLGNVDRYRSSVVVMVSDDGVNFDKWYLLADEAYSRMKEGMCKEGLYGYPTSYFDDEYMYVIYSLYKESVEVLRVPLASIGVK